MKQQKFKRRRFFHFTTRFVHRKWYQMSSYRNWLDFLQSLKKIQQLRLSEDIIWHSGVLMCSNMHLIFSTETYNEHSVILDLEQALQKELGVRTHLFQRPLPCEPLYQLADLRSASKFIYRNPVRAGIVRKVEDYTYSSLYLLLNKDRPALNNPFCDPLQVIQNLPTQLRWLNSETEFEQQSFEIFRDERPGF